MLARLIADEIEKMQGEVSVILKDLASDSTIVAINEEAVFPAASMIKLPIMVEAFRQAFSDDLELHRKVQISKRDKVDYSVISELEEDRFTLRDLIVLMIIVSDNTATNVLIDILGMEKINGCIREIGMVDTVLQRKMMDFEAARQGRQNLTTARDLIHLLQRLYNKELLRGDISESMLDILKRQKDKEMLKRYIPEDTLVAHKTGELENLNHDAGIFYLDQGAYILGVFVRDTINNVTAKEYIGHISKIAYDFYTSNKI